MSIELDKNTFGSTKAAETLADILSKLDNPRVLARVTTFLSEHNQLLNEVSAIRDVHARLTIINMIGDKIKTTKLNWPEKVVSYAKNVAQSKVKMYRELDECIVNEMKRYNRTHDNV